jgi:hypothetical protein
LIPIPDTDNPLVLRTDYTDDVAWETLSEVVQAPVGEFRAYVTLVSNPSYRGLTVAQVLELLPAAFRRNFVFVADETAIRDSEHPVLVIDLQEEPGRTFRVIPSEMWGVENNLSIANMDFQDFVDYVDLDGVFRGFPRGAG